MLEMRQVSKIYRTELVETHALRALDPDSLSPREALDALYRLKQLAADPDSP